MIARTIRIAMFSTMMSLSLIAGCALDVEDDDEDIESSEDSLKDLDEEACEGGFLCKIGGHWNQDDRVRVTCEGRWTTMAFCYSTKGACAAKHPAVGGQVCLADAPDGSDVRKTRCLNDPCCVACKGEADEDE